MWEYKVISGSYTIEPGTVKVRNPAGEGALQQILDHYGGDRWELVSLHLDVTQNAIMVFKRPKGGVAMTPGMAPGMAPPVPIPVAAPPPAYPGYPPPPATGGYGAPPAYGAPPGYPPQPAAAPIDPDMPARRRAPGATPGGGTPGRRSKKDLDRLARDD